MFEQNIELGAERSSDALSNSFHHPFTINIVDESVSKYTDALVSPESNSDVRVGERVFLDTTETTDDLTHISQVESIVRLDGSGSEIFLDSLVDLESSHHDLLVHSTDLRVETSSAEVVAENRGEDGLHGVLVSKREGDGVEMALEAGSDNGFTTAGRSHSAD